MTVDSTFEFEKRRNIPVRYDRELLQTTIKAMKRVGEIRQRREQVFWKNRMATAREMRRAMRIKKKSKLEKPSVTLVEPIEQPKETIGSEKIKEKVRKHHMPKTALLRGDNQTMSMQVD